MAESLSSLSLSSQRTRSISIAEPAQHNNQKLVRGLTPTSIRKPCIVIYNLFDLRRRIHVITVFQESLTVTICIGKIFHASIHRQTERDMAHERGQIRRVPTQWHKQQRALPHHHEFKMKILRARGAHN